LGEVESSEVGKLEVKSGSWRDEWNRAGGWLGSAHWCGLFAANNVDDDDGDDDGEGYAELRCQL
jgi:hypothetical protein